MPYTLITCVPFVLLSSTLLAGGVDPLPKGTRSYPPNMPGAKEAIYKTVGDVELKLYIFTPKDHKATDERPAIVFFFGGGWNAGTPGQFYPQSQHFAKRGMVAICVDYRVKTRHNVKPAACVEDAKSAIRWVRQHARQLGIHPQKIVASGGSAGGHLAAATGILTTGDLAAEDRLISSQPNAMILYNPALVLAPFGNAELKSAELFKKLDDRFGGKQKELSPIHHLRKGLPPCLILHGTLDPTVPYKTAEAFATASKAKGNRCELIGYKGEQHGFFNWRSGQPPRMYLATTQAADRFLVSLGYLSPMKDE